MKNGNALMRFCKYAQLADLKGEALQAEVCRSVREEVQVTPSELMLLFFAFLSFFSLHLLSQAGQRSARMVHSIRSSLCVSACTLSIVTRRCLEAHPDEPLSFKSVP